MKRLGLVDSKSGGSTHPAEWNVPWSAEGCKSGQRGCRKDKDKKELACLCEEGRERCERRWRKGRGLVRPHAVNTPQWHRNVTGLSSKTFASSFVSLRLLLALFYCSSPKVLLEFSREKTADFRTLAKYRV